MINKAILMGRLTRDPELRHTGTGTPVCSFSIAIDNGYGENRQTDFINCVAFGRSAEFAERYLRQGTKIAITGRIQTGSYTNKDGVKVYTTDIVVEEQIIELLPAPIPTNININDTTLTWDSVKDITSYEVEISNGENTFNIPTNNLVIAFW